MKRFICLVVCFSAITLIESQGLNLLGKSSYKLKQSYGTVKPCEENYKYILYCYSDNEKVAYSLENNKVSAIQFMDFFNSKYQAITYCENEISIFSKQFNIEPVYIKENNLGTYLHVLFIDEGNPVGVAYDVSLINNSFISRTMYFYK